jgi:hypothetical protein
MKRIVHSCSTTEGLKNRSFTKNLFNLYNHAGFEKPSFYQLPQTEYYLTKKADFAQAKSAFLVYPEYFRISSLFFLLRTGNDKLSGENMLEDRDFFQKGLHKVNDFCGAGWKEKGNIADVGPGRYMPASISYPLL